VVLANKPIITDDSATLEPALLKTLMEQISTLASVYHKPADTFVSRQRLAVQTVDSVAGRTFEEEEGTSAAAAAAQVGLSVTGLVSVWLAATVAKHAAMSQQLGVSGAVSGLRLDSSSCCC
jgi:hypothetical protein